MDVDIKIDQLEEKLNTELDGIRRRYLGGELSKVLQEMRDLTPDKRIEIGMRLNAFKHRVDKITK